MSRRSSTDASCNDTSLSEILRSPLAGLLLPLLLLSVACSGSAPPKTAQGAVVVRYDEEPVTASAPSPAQADPGAMPVAAVAAEPEPVQLADEVDLAGRDHLEEQEARGDRAPARVDSDRLLEESLQAYESAQVFWQQGSFEDAFAALDRAYELMSQVPPNGDDLIAQEKEDLRHLISRRVIEIYASRQTVVGDVSGEIPREINEYVEREIKSFQGPERDFFLESYQRSGLYRPMIVEELRKAGMPEEISWLPLVESGFKVKALSRARALGLWQFISSTGYRYGLERTWWVDERMDPVKATRGAIGYLTDLHNLFGDWSTALAGYNCGERNVLKAINRQRESYFDHFWDVYSRLPRETRRYVPRFIATLLIVEDPAKYGFELPEPLPAIEFETRTIERAAQLATLDSAMDLPAGTLVALNPELRRGATPDEPYELKVPTGRGETLMASLAGLPQWTPPQNSYTVHRVRRGETLSGIADRYSTRVSEIMDMNNLRSANRIWPGQQLRVPDRYGSGGGGVVATSGSEITYSVRRGDSLWTLAKRYGTTVDRIRRDNGLRSNTLRPGQTLKIRSGSTGGTYVVQRGDTLGKIADSKGVSLSRLLQANGLSRRSTIYPGQRLQIPN